MNAKTIVMLLKNLMLMANSINAFNFFQQPEQYLEILDEIERSINLVLILCSFFYSHGWIYIYRIGIILFKISIIIGGVFWYCSQRLYGDLIIIESWLENLIKQAPISDIPDNNIDPITQVIQQDNTSIVMPDISTQVIQENVTCTCKKIGNFLIEVIILIFI